MSEQQKNSRGIGNFLMERTGGVKWLVIKLVAIALFIGVSIALYANGWTCPILRFFGVECFSCGLTRAWLAVLRLDFVAAFSYNFMFPAVPILFLYLLFNGKLFTNKVINALLFCLILAGFATLFTLRIVGVL